MGKLQRKEVKMSECKRCKIFKRTHEKDDRGCYIIKRVGTITYAMSEPICAFRSGIFNKNNWNCATMSLLRNIVENENHPLYVGYCRDDGISDTIGIIRIPDPPDETCQTGYIVLTYYKERGTVGNAIVVRDDKDPEPLRLKTAEWVIKWCEENYKER